MPRTAAAATAPQQSRKQRSPLRAAFNYDVSAGEELLNRAKKIVTTRHEQKNFQTYSSQYLEVKNTSVDKSSIKKVQF